ncbi:MAG: adenosylcobalamin-dependent ribonucleoside-diphosphate reductase [Proteobacteria bacterium]|nr:adenosylcobalamin-dependent ribonucleoside-diphosphate reductase [Pseudomonadota bacterium]
MKLTKIAEEVLKSRYYLKDKDGNITEDFEHLCRRVSEAVAEVDRSYKDDYLKTFDDFYEIIHSLKFLPNSPTLMNAGTKKGQLSACFVLPIKDNLKSIFETLKKSAIIHKSGGGTGFSFSDLRPAGDIVASTKGVSSGPISFMQIYDMATNIIKQGGKRRGANMGILHITHPDILSFIKSKEKEGFLTNFNISVSLGKDEISTIKNGGFIPLINPRTKKTEKKIKAEKLFDEISYYAWLTGDPGLINLYAINFSNPTPHLGYINATNPCGEQPLLPYESCTLGSINLAKFVKNKRIDYEELKRVVRIAIHFLDNVLDANSYPFREIEKISKRNRKIGLGVMGFADALILMNVAYSSKYALQIAEDIMRFINEQAVFASENLAKKRGAFPEFSRSIYSKRGDKKRRNATVTTIAPTGTISIIAGTSSGIEPIFSFKLKRRILDREFEDIHPLYRELKDRKEYDKKIFETTFDIKPEQHLMMQFAFQKYTENAVSKTVNLPSNAKVEDVKEIFKLALELNLKGITIYRDKSKPKQTLNFCNLNPDKEC